MYKSTTNHVTVMTVLDTRHPKKNGLCSVRIQILHRGRQKVLTTGKELSEKQWAKLSDSRAPDLIEIRDTIRKLFEQTNKLVEEMAIAGEFSFDEFDKRLRGAQLITLNESLKVKILCMREEERIGSMHYYKSVLSSVEKFAGPNIPLENISVDWLNRYEKHLRSRNIRYSTIGMQMRGIRAMMLQAKKNGIIKDLQYPFGKDKYEIKTGESIKKALSFEQLAKIASYSDGNEYTDKYRDLWMFIYYCNGINVADLTRLKFKNIVDGEICFVRQKTKRTTRVVKEIRAVIVPEMQAIIDRWGNKPKPDNFIFPLISPHNQNDPLGHAREVKQVIKHINAKMKMIGAETGVGVVTTYTARHSFATVLKRSGANIAYIAESLGHSDLKTTESYLGSFEKEERKKNAEFLTRFKEAK